MAGDLRAHVLLDDQRRVQDFGGATVLSFAACAPICNFDPKMTISYPSREKHIPDPVKFGSNVGFYTKAQDVFCLM